MKFTEEIINHMTCLVCGNYKIIKLGDKYTAYFKPFGWKNWGNSCVKNIKGNSKKYETTKQAISDCEKHLEKFGENPGATDSIFE